MTWNFLKKKVTVPGKPEEETITYRRKKAKGKRQAIFQQFKPEVIHHELTGEACT
ncbi:IS66 family transposase, partial [Enterococcus cecorum]